MRGASRESRLIAIKMALSVILKDPPDLIVSGINEGSNAGPDIFYSGTVGGVIEGVLHDIPGAAFSSSELLKTRLSLEQKPIFYKLCSI